MARESERNPADHEMRTHREREAQPRITQLRRLALVMLEQAVEPLVADDVFRPDCFSGFGPRRDRGHCNNRTTRRLHGKLVSTTESTAVATSFRNYHPRQRRDKNRPAAFGTEGSRFEHSGPNTALLKATMCCESHAHRATPFDPNRTTSPQQNAEPGDNLRVIASQLLRITISSISRQCLQSPTPATRLTPQVPRCVAHRRYG